MLKYLFKYEHGWDIITYNYSSAEIVLYFMTFAVLVAALVTGILMLKQ